MILSFLIGSDSSRMEFTSKPISKSISSIYKGKYILKDLNFLSIPLTIATSYSARLIFVVLIKEKFPSIKTFVWTGYTLKQLQEMYEDTLLENVDVLIDGPFIESERDITLKLRGSKNQRILYRGVDY